MGGKGGGFGYFFSGGEAKGKSPNDRIEAIDLISFECDLLCLCVDFAVVVLSFPMCVCFMPAVSLWLERFQAN